MVNDLICEGANSSISARDERVHDHIIFLFAIIGQKRWLNLTGFRKPLVKELIKTLQGKRFVINADVNW